MQYKNVRTSPSNQVGFISSIFVVVILLIMLIVGIYYLGTKNNTIINKLISNLVSNTTINIQAPSPNSSKNRKYNVDNEDFTAWKQGTGNWLLYLPSSWSAASFDSDVFSEIRVYVDQISWEESHSGKDLSEIEALYIYISLPNSELSTDTKLSWKEEGSNMKSNTLILQSQKGPFSFSISYPKDTIYKDKEQINEVIENINFKATSQELKAAKIIP